MKTISRVLFLSLIATFCCVSLIAQDSKPKAAAKPAAAPQGMPMPQPSPEMTKLTKMLAGNWNTAEKFEVSPMMPKGGTGKGTASFKPGPGGLSLMENYQSKGAMGGSFKGMGTWWWDPKAQAFRGVWCDNATPYGCDAGGTSKWDGDKLVGTMQSDMNGQMMTLRFTYSDFKPGSFVMTMEMGPDPSKLQKSMTINYTRAAAGGKM